ncbi:hypothetical protein [Oleiharenicola lentus]|uniref:hypothetical protein n=1 Tax=Oleiharenicola lentus TaxID=2508720 RepID=UPI003F67479D
MKKTTTLFIVLLLTGCASMFDEPTGKKRQKIESERAIAERSSDYAARSAEKSEQMRKFGNPNSR